MIFSRRSFVALQHRNFRLIWIGLFFSFTGSTMQNAALLWQVSLLVPPDQKGLALGLVGLVRVVPIVVFSMLGRRRRRCVEPAKTDAGHADRVRPCRAVARVPDIPRVVERVADLRAGGPQFRRGRVRPAGAARAAADAGAPRASAECDRPQRHHVPDGVGGRPGARRRHDRDGRPGMDLRGQHPFLRVRDRRAARHAERARSRAVGRRLARRRVVARRARRPAIRVPGAAHPIDDAARFLRDVLFVGDGAAADFRAGHPARRGAGLRPVVRGACRGRADHERGDGVSGRADRAVAVQRSCGPSAVTGSRP